MLARRSAWTRSGRGGSLISFSRSGRPQPRSIDAPLSHHCSRPIRARAMPWGKAITADLYAIFRREKEEGVQPVLKDDVAEVLRRRFFTAKSIENRDSFRGHVVAALKGIADLDDQTRKEGKAAEERYLNSYPFHPDLIDVFYAKCTQLEGFQRTRGVLRTFAFALRES